MLLQKQGRALGWRIVASVAALRPITGAVRTGARALLTLPGRAEPMDAVELRRAWPCDAGRRMRLFPLRGILAASLVLLATVPARAGARG